jgi:hypothetical protein
MGKKQVSVSFIYEGDNEIELLRQVKEFLKTLKIVDVDIHVKKRDENYRRGY